MDTDVLAVLLAADDPVGAFFPIGFDEPAEMARLRPLLPLVEAVVGRPFELKRTQDASFLADIATYDRGTVPWHSGPTYLGALVVRFSNFGHLFTICSAVAPEKELPPAVVTRVIDLVTQHGYQYVPYEVLDAEPYTGINPHRYLQGVSWFRRYFDWL